MSVAYVQAKFTTDFNLCCFIIALEYMKSYYFVFI